MNDLKPAVGKTSVLTWIKLHKCPCKVHIVMNATNSYTTWPMDTILTAISQENQNDPPMSLTVNLVETGSCIKFPQCPISRKGGNNPQNLMWFLQPGLEFGLR